MEQEDTAAQKRELRRELRERANALDSAYISAASQDIARFIFCTLGWRFARSVFCFVGGAHEVDTRALISSALSYHKQLYVPRCTTPGHMDICQINSLDELEPGLFGILEPPVSALVIPPSDIDLALIPCLSCTKSGARLGKGGGYYDRFLANFHGNAWALCFEKMLSKTLPLEPHDQPVGAVITEKGFYPRP